MRAASRALFAFSALCLAAGGCLHALGFSKASGVVSQSNLAALFAAAFRGLWLSNSATMLGLALVFGFIALRPHAATKPLTILLGLVPLACAVTIYSMMGSFFGGHVFALAGAAAILGGALNPPALPSTQ